MTCGSSRLVAIDISGRNENAASAGTRPCLTASQHAVLSSNTLYRWISMALLQIYFKNSSVCLKSIRNRCRSIEY